MNEIVTKYLEEVIKTFKTGHAREHAYRPALEMLVETINPAVNAVNDPKQQKVGAPDFVLLKNKTPIGYIEAKDINVDLDKEFKTKNQFNRYKASLNNLCFTNYLEFVFYLNGKEVQRIELAKLVDKKIEVLQENIPLFESVLKNFTTAQTVSIKSPKELASLMAEKAKMLKNVIYLALQDKEQEQQQIEKQFEVFKQMLIHDLSHEQYADIYAQTVAYGMFAARYHDKSIDTFSKDEAGKLLPKSNPFLRNFFDTITGINIDDRIVWIVDDMAELFNHVDVRELLVNYGKDTKRSDVIVHFYETFLAEYDQKMRKARGVYYTPEPVVDFIVRAVDDILKKEFGISEGLADTSKIEVQKEIQGQKKKAKVMEHRVQVLDPATGTGTFLDHIIKHIYNSKFKGQEGLWQSYVDEHLLPRLHGFEILMASYAMAHLKLDITLAETGYDSSKGQGKRLGVYLTNSLEEPEAHQRDLFSQWLTTESLEANEVKKEKPIMVVVGNPPYSGHSSNKSEYSQALVDKYKIEPGGKMPLNERTSKWLNDDYVKFISYAEELVKKNGEGIVAYINNNSWIENPTFRGMRWFLGETFNKIIILNLHGDSKKKEKTPDGKNDENVFDIMQGVSINIFIRNNKKGKSKILYYDVFGKRESKYEFLYKNKYSVAKEIIPKGNTYLFTPYDNSLFTEYAEFIYIGDLFNIQSMGVTSARDNFVIDINQQDLVKRIKDFLNLDISNETIKSNYDLKENSAWKLDTARKSSPKFESSYLMKIDYRVFDSRYIYYEPNLVFRDRSSVMNNFIKGSNFGLNLTKRGRDESKFNYFITSTITDKGITSSLDNSNTFILYRYDVDFSVSSRVANFDQKIIDEIAKKLDLKFIPDHEHEDAGKKDTFNPLDILDYIYAILHSPTYRERYKEFLKIDFPRVPFTSDPKLFWALVVKGRELRKYHLMEHKESTNLITKFPVSGENDLTQTPKFEDNKVWINETQYFDEVSETAWNFYIGGYQPAQKWLKDRKGRKLSFDEVLHYQRIIVALVNTDILMKEIDKLIPKWPIK